MVSRIILEPIKLRIENAAQWSNSDIKSNNARPPNQPIRGIKAWKSPKNAPTLKPFRILLFLVVSPSIIETEKQSIARLNAISTVSAAFNP
jgi:hypothetical protein